MSYTASNTRYATMTYHRSGNSGLKLPALSLGLWHNFGSNGNYENMKAMCFTAFDHGITHFDLANNYGPEPGSAERNFGRILREELHAYRDELVISTKAGYTMWDGPYGDWGSRKYLLASLDQSLKRMGVDYVDIFYHHRMDPNTPLEESMMALDTASASPPLPRKSFGRSTRSAPRNKQAKRNFSPLGKEVPFLRICLLGVVFIQIYRLPRSTPHMRTQQ